MKLGGFSSTLGAAAALSLLIAGASMNVSAGPNPDVDGDGVKNLVDNCVQASNPDNDQANQSGPLDADRDGFGNACDADYNNNGTINTQDFAQFSAAYGTGYPGDAAYSDVIDMNANGTINTQDFASFSSGYGAGVPGPSALKCASTVAGSDNLTGEIPCDHLVTYRVKCQAGSSYGAGVIKSTVTGTDLRFLRNADYRPAGVGPEYAHCD
ncbi:MAG: thrombospondin type 3 repeat-containing protein [Dechloromonas sp.]|nr:thrombospondin type 3 repeat-containing protein [Dechloromonas sp.]